MMPTLLGSVVSPITAAAHISRIAPRSIPLFGIMMYILVFSRHQLNVRLVTALD
jgi:hypothetical protein